jgi:hypothetical protein
MGRRGLQQQLAAVQMLFGWFITGQVVPTKPASPSAVPRLTVRDLRDRPLIGILTQSLRARWRGALTQEWITPVQMERTRL